MDFYFILFKGSLLFFSFFLYLSPYYARMGCVLFDFCAVVCFLFEKKIIVGCFK